MSSRNQSKLTRELNAVIAEKLAGFFFDFWERRNSAGLITPVRKNLSLKDVYAKQITKQ